MSHNITVEGGKSVRLLTAGKYCDRDIVVSAEGGGGDTEEAFEAGRKAEYDAFWDAYQDRGRNTYYAEAFSGYGWNDETFKPKYDIKPENSINRIFYQTKVTNLKQALLNCGVTMDLSKATRCQNGFGSSSLTTLPKLNLSKATNIQQIFAESTNLASIDELVVSTSTAFSSCFTNCTSLTHMIVTGTIAKSGFDVQYSTKLDKESLTSIVNALSATTSGLSVTLSKTAVNNAFTTSEWDALRATKTNWTINLV